MPSNTIRSVTATINGVTYTLTPTQDGGYSASGTAPAGSSFPLTGGYYPVSVRVEYDTGAATVVNDETPGTLGQSCRLVVKEKVKPVTVIESPTSGQYQTTALQSVVFRITDNNNGQSNGFSGVNVSSIRGSIVSVSKSINISFTGADVTSEAITGGYRFTYAISSGLPDATDYVITINASDNDGNAADAASVSFVVDTTPPELSVTSPVEGLRTYSSLCPVEGVTSDITTSPVTLQIYLNDTLVETISGSGIAQDGSFSTSVTFTTAGNNVVKVVATDTAGKTSTVSRNVFFSDSVPIIHSVTLVPNPVDGGTSFSIEVDVE